MNQISTDSICCAAASSSLVPTPGIYIPFPCLTKMAAVGYTPAPYEQVSEICEICDFWCIQSARYLLSNLARKMTPCRYPAAVVLVVQTVKALIYSLFSFFQPLISIGIL